MPLDLLNLRGKEVESAINMIAVHQQRPGEETKEAIFSPLLANDTDSSSLVNRGRRYEHRRVRSNVF